MLRSMTAFGRARRTVGNKDITVELKSVNSRYFDCNIKISRMYAFLEERVKSHLQSAGISRGKVDLYIGVDLISSTNTTILLDEGYAASYIHALKELRERFSLTDDISVMSVAQNRDIFIDQKSEEDAEQDFADICVVLDEALAAFCAMREAEGKNLRDDLCKKVELIRSYAQRVEEFSKTDISSYQSKLETRIRQLLSEYDVHVDESRLLTEVAIFADKVAIDEELVRLASHFSAFYEMIDQKEPVGRKLDFLLQEMNRETNTIGSKANNTEIARIVIEIKSELEKIREQIQNIE